MLQVRKEKEMGPELGFVSLFCQKHSLHKILADLPASWVLTASDGLHRSES